MKRVFRADIEKRGGGVRIALPFDPNEAWGAKGRHHVTGTVGGGKVRGELKKDAGGWFLALGPAWVRDNPTRSPVEVDLAPEGPNLADDLVAALKERPPAKSFFESLPTFYRNNFVRWIEEAKRPATRAERIKRTVALCEEGRRER